MVKPVHVAFHGNQQGSVYCPENRDVMIFDICHGNRDMMLVRVIETWHLSW